MGSSTQYFYDVVVITERIEQRIKAGRILEPTEKKGFNGRKKDAEMRNVERWYKCKKNYQTQSY